MLRCHIIINPGHCIQLPFVGRLADGDALGDIFRPLVNLDAVQARLIAAHPCIVILAAIVFGRDGHLDSYHVAGVSKMIRQVIGSNNMIYRVRPVRVLRDIVAYNRQHPGHIPHHRAVLRDGIVMRDSVVHYHSVPLHTLDHWLAASVCPEHDVAQNDARNQAIQ